MKNVRAIFLALLCMLLAVATVSATGEIQQIANPLNYWGSQSHTITVTNLGNATTTATINSPWAVTATGGNCTNAVDDVTCVLGAGEKGTYVVTSDAALPEYAKTNFTMGGTGGYTSNTVNIIRIKEEELFRTLIEFSRGRGDYFFDSGSQNRKGQQCTDLPADTAIELNYLHKVYPILNNYFNIPSAEGSNVSIYCEYPNVTITKQHLATNVAFSGAFAKVNFTSDFLENSWEKVFFLVQDFDASQYAVGDKMTINCTSMSYYLAGANGWVVANANAFNLNFRNSTPLTLTATSDVPEIGTGTQEVVITYTLTNTENMTLSASSNPITVDIQAPQGAEFIGTRGELWGTALGTYHLELNSMMPFESKTFSLVAKFTTTGTGVIDLCSGADVKFVPCWQINAYNPMATNQYLTCAGSNITVNATAVAVTSVQGQLSDIGTNLSRVEAKIDLLNNTVNQINSTVNNIKTIVQQINATTNATYSTVVENNGLLMEINYTTNASYAYETGTMTNILVQINSTTNATYNVVNNIQTIVNGLNQSLLEINSTTNATLQFLQGTIEQKLDEINATTQNTSVTVREINQTVNNVNGTVNAINNTVNTIQVIVSNINVTTHEINNTANATYTLLQTLDLKIDNNTVTINGINYTVNDINNTVNLMNLTLNNVNSTVNGINLTVFNINTTVNNMQNLLNYFNNTVFGDMNLTEIYNSIIALNMSTMNLKLDNLTTNLRQLDEFSQESIYLITDSITEGQQSYSDALTALKSGDKEGAMIKLQQSIDKLNQAQKYAEAAQVGQTLQDIKNGKSDIGIVEKMVLWLAKIFG